MVAKLRNYNRIIKIQFNNFSIHYKLFQLKINTIIISQFCNYIIEPKPNNLRYLLIITLVFITFRIY